MLTPTDLFRTFALYDEKGQIQGTEGAWVEESFQLNDHFQNSHSFRGGSYMGNSITRRHILIFLVFAGLVLSLILSRITTLQLIRGKDYLLYAEANRERKISIPSERGLIIDRNGTPLTKNVPNFALALVPQDLPKQTEKRKEIVNRLATLTGRNAEDIFEELNHYGNYSYRSVVIQENLDYDTALSIQIAVADLPGLYIERGSKRLYLSEAETLSHVLGYEGKVGEQELENLRGAGYLSTDLIGKTGLEKSYETMLRGTYGEERVEVNVVGKRQQVLSEVSPKAGQNIVLHIDENIQQQLEKLLVRSLQASGKKRAAAVALDPRTGGILGIVSLPTFDNNAFANGIASSTYREYISNEDQPLFQRAIAGTYPSGSSMKPAIAAAALSEGVITSKTSILSTGGIQVGPWFFPDWRAGGHGNTDVRESLAWSVNTFYYYIGGGNRNFDGLGIDRLSAYMEKFGLGKDLGIDIPGEASGLVPNPAWKKATKNEQWYIGDTYNLSIGQGDLLVTPLQVAAMTAVIANGGTLYEPHVAAATMDPITEKLTEIPPVILQETVVPKNAIIPVRLGMRDCVVYGSCQHLAQLSIAVAGKTGTAQWHSQKNTHAWFTSFAPFDEPEIVLTLIIEEGGEGGLAATPIARDFYVWWAEYRRHSSAVVSKIPNS